jgi:phosphoenolpyruvate synthase/pyruvate phosphate dikinase
MDLLITGIAASSGVATGPVVVIMSPDTFDTMVDDAVLVCPMTTPEWVPVMTRAVAIVTDEGGKMSHAAIVCRELGTPAVVGTSTATQNLAGVGAVTVDGEKGHVYAAP